MALVEINSCNGFIVSLRTVVIIKPQASGILLWNFTSPNFVYMCCIDFSELKQMHQEFSLYLLSYLVCCTLTFLQLIYWLFYNLFTDFF